GIGLGTRLPIHCTAAGKALLARLPEAEQRSLITQLRLNKRGPKTIVTKTALRAELERIAAEDVAIEDEELLAGRCAVAAVVQGKDGRAIAAVELAVPVQACTPKELRTQLAPKVVAAAERIAAALT
ncbi:MAG TPA: IclR family transcriptional regulator C-terminal domain-containing protein, partial [Solirubrobacteraceae bacterium]|nr:IclR family transcriptional regulator C-terminal domain-containing protein [Solirubrobacteraceae bacterium]